MSNDWKLLLRTGFGNIFDVGYGWNYEGQCLVAKAINADSEPDRTEAWAAVKKFCQRKTTAAAAC